MVAKWMLLIMLVFSSGCGTGHLSQSDRMAKMRFNIAVLRQRLKNEQAYTRELEKREVDNAAQRIKRQQAQRRAGSPE